MPVAEWLVHPEGEEEFARAERGPDDLVTLHRPGHGGGQAGRCVGGDLEEPGADVEQDRSVIAWAVLPPACRGKALALGEVVIW